jgi:hypothetical protein
MTYPYLTYKTSGGTIVTSTTTYASSDVIGSIQRLPNISRDGFIQGVTITSRGSTTVGQIDVLIFNSSMPNSTFTDNSAIAISSLDYQNVVTSIHITDWTAMGTPSIGVSNGLGYTYSVSGSTAYYALVARAAISLASSNGLLITFNMVA